MGGEDLFRLREYEHRFAPRLLLRAFDSVLEARGLRCGARAALGRGAARFVVELRLRRETTSQLKGRSHLIGSRNAIDHIAKGRPPDP